MRTCGKSDIMEGRVAIQLSYRFDTTGTSDFFLLRRSKRAPAESVIFYEIDFCRVVTCRINENVLGNRASMSVNSKLLSHFSTIYPLRYSYRFLVGKVKLRLILKP